ncbi:MAG TPA: regulator [Thermoplasmataceae archaeon]|nr:regulator [Thermoplasmataceae archaeon]
MLLILEEYFKDHPIKRKIVEGLYERGISVQNGRLFVGGIEVSISEISKLFNVNRRTVYDTIKLIQSSPEISQVMSLLRPCVDISGVAPLMGDQVLTIRIAPGFFRKALTAVMQFISKYGCYVKEIKGTNMGADDIYIRAVFYRSVPRKIFEDIGSIEGINKLIIETPESTNLPLICDKCEVRVCPNKLSTSVLEQTMSEL